jgi:DNA-binding NarL/FixJ family response regulator
MRIVLVDDHALFRDGVASLLLAWGHEVVGQASDGGEAVELVDQTSPDVVIVRA